MNRNEILNAILFLFIGFELLLLPDIVEHIYKPYIVDLLDVSDKIKSIGNDFLMFDTMKNIIRS